MRLTLLSWLSGGAPQAQDREIRAVFTNTARNTAQGAENQIRFRIAPNTVLPANRRPGADNRSALGAKKAIDLVKAGANLRLQRKLDTMDYESQMRSWLTEPVDSDSDDDDDDEEDGARPAGGAAAADE